jgi:ATP-dependent DNA helicase RecQ
MFNIVPLGTDMHGTDPIQTLQQYWGFAEFRQGQLEVVNSVLQGRDTLAILSTGAGKSICYQVPAMMFPSICVVLSPLVALMRDQVYSLLRKKIAAVAITSSMTRYEQDQTYEAMLSGKYKFIFVSPERAKSERFRAYLADIAVSLLVVDEAHCISQWGYDFRPPYLDIAELREFCGAAPVLALTASATEVVQQDIVTHLHLRNAQIFKGTVFRQNLSLSCVQAQSKYDTLLHLLRKVQGSTLVYCRNRGTSVRVAEFLVQNNYTASFYHAGLQAQQRASAQDQWLNDEVPIMCCTNAFGMGIDKPNVRLVVHFDAPDSIEAYYQEVGRAGRDGQPSFAVLLYHATEFGDIEYHVQRRFPPNTFLRDIYQKVADYLRIPFDEAEGQSYNFDIIHCAKTLDLDLIMLSNCLKLLEQQGLMQLSESIMLPSKVQCIASRAQLDYAEQFIPALDNVLKALLRLYAGIFYAPVAISETKIAAHCGLDVNQVRQYLHNLHTQEYISYQEARDKPQLFLLRERLHPYDLRLNEGLLNFLRSAFEQRLQKAYAYYINQKQCRSKIIANYFGEESIADCGTCNNCTRAKKQTLNQEIIDTLQQQISNLLRAHESTMYDLQHQLSSYDSGEIQQVVYAMLEQDLLQFRPNGNLTLNNE